MFQPSNWNLNSEGVNRMYRLDLTEDDINTIFFVSYRYSWSSNLIQVGISEGVNEFTESDAWYIKLGIDSDCEGGHDGYPMLDTSSDLCEKLHKLYLEIE